MFSKRLKENGLLNFIGGSHFNFRAVTAGKTIKEDYEGLLEKAGITNPLEIYSGQQTHSTNVVQVEAEEGEPFLVGREFPETDGLLTAKKHIALVIKFADCTPIVLYDPTEKVQAIVHSGWRGTVGEISKIAIEKMVNDFDVKLENIFAYVGPSIDQENYEVGAEVYEAFSMNPDRDLFFKPYGKKYLLDMSLANIQLLLQAGLKEENIEVEKTSTFISENLHSARKEGKNYGLNAMVTYMQ